MKITIAVCQTILDGVTAGKESFEYDGLPSARPSEYADACAGAIAAKTLLAGVSSCDGGVVITLPWLRRLLAAVDGGLNFVESEGFEGSDTYAALGSAAAHLRDLIDEAEADDA